VQVYPATLQYLGKGTANIMSIFWFGTLATLGIDSLFAMVEGVVTLLTDTRRLAHYSRETVALWVCMLGFMGSTIYVSEISRYFLDIVEHYVLNYTLIFVGALQAYAVSWVWGWPECQARTGTLCATPRPALVWSLVCVQRDRHDEELCNCMPLSRWRFIAS
jgi:SNF family Na+-dependent transporter